MSNKIHGYGQPQLPTARESRVTPAEGIAQGDAKPVTPVAPARDSVSVSDTALLLQKLEESVAHTSPVNMDRVQHIKDALSRNEYQIDTQRVADKLLKAERELTER